jgi:antitoxin (DNA-binding transcriptional repressor) of toxin-antitoxin stability system
MMKTFTTDYAAQHLDELIDLALQGQVILLSLNGDPVARLIPIDDESGAEVPPAEVEEAFYGD